LDKNNAKKLFLLLIAQAKNNFFEIAIRGASILKDTCFKMAILYLIKRQIFN
jgi:hypothetical protein